MTNDPALVTLPVGMLFDVDGVLDTQINASVIIRNTGLAELAFSQLRSLAGGMLVADDPALRSVQLPMLSRARWLAIQGDNAIESRVVCQKSTRAGSRSRAVRPVARGHDLAGFVHAQMVHRQHAGGVSLRGVPRSSAMNGRCQQGHPGAPGTDRARYAAIVSS